MTSETRGLINQVGAHFISASVGGILPPPTPMALASRRPARQRLRSRIRTHSKQFVSPTHSAIFGNNRQYSASICGPTGTHLQYTTQISFFSVYEASGRQVGNAKRRSFDSLRLKLETINGIFLTINFHQFEERWSCFFLLKTGRDTENI